MGYSLHVKALTILAFALATFGQASLVSSSGKRCVLEKKVKRSGEEVYTCRTSKIDADRLKDWVETDQCITACGLDRKTLGISSDPLVGPRFIQKLCSPQCYTDCPNVADLFFSLAAGEGVFLPKLCEALRPNARREMSEIWGSGYLAPGPVYSEKLFTKPSGDPWAAPVMAPAEEPCPYTKES